MKNYFKISTVQAGLFMLLLASMMIYPGMNGLLKIILLLLFIVARLVSGRLNNYSSLGVKFSIYYGLLGAIFSVVGILNGVSAIYVYENFNLYVSYPILLGLIASSIRVSEIKYLMNILVVVSSVVAYVILLIVYMEFNGLEVPFFGENNVASIGYFDGYTRFSYKIIDTLNFISPFLISYYYLAYSRSGKSIYLLQLTIVLFITLISGRKTLWLILIFNILLLLIFHRKRNRSVLIMLSIPIFLIFGYVLNIETLLDLFIAGLDFGGNSDVGATIRGEQTVALLNGLIDAPLFGHGIGSSAIQYGSIRDFEAPYAYELSYLYNLFQFGIVGFILYLFGPVYINYKLFIYARNMKNYRFLALFYGLLGFYVSISSNPWLTKFDFMYIIFIPFSLVLACMRLNEDDNSISGCSS